MAPALTEPGQTQNLKLAPTHSSPTSPTAAVRAVSDEVFFCDVARHLIKSDGIPNGDGVCINGTKVKTGLANLKPSRPRIVIPAESRFPSRPDGASDTNGELGSLMMNSDPPNQDNSNNMGLQKSNSGMLPSLETGGYMKENFLPNEMDQLFKNLGAAINSSDIGQNMDDLLQVFKSMESNIEGSMQQPTHQPQVEPPQHMQGLQQQPVGQVIEQNLVQVMDQGMDQVMDQGIIGQGMVHVMDQSMGHVMEHAMEQGIVPNVDPVASVLDDALVTSDPVESGESDGMFHITDGTDLTSGLSTFEREILNEVELNMCVDDVNLADSHLTESHLVVGSNLVESSLVGTNLIESNLAETSLPVLKEADTKQRLEEARRKQFESERRCEWLMRRLRKLQTKSMGRHSSEEINGLMQHTQRLMQESQVQTQEVGRERRPPRSLSQMLKQLEESAHTAANTKHPASRYFGSGTNDRTPSVPTGVDSVNLGEEVKVELGKVSSQLYTQLRMVENAMDSDVTASSSGGESCDEMVTYNNQHQQPLSIMKRAAWKWAQERAGVASRWTWLQAQISDLEYRIRQHTEIHRQIRLNKGEVKLGGPDPVLLTGHPTQVVNGFHATSSNTNAEPPECMGATGTCRTRPFIRTNYRKRKLLNTAGLHLVSKKAARHSTIRCGCRPPLPPCALCTGRSDPTYPRETPDLLTVQERIALLDPAYHPVLSFPSDVTQSVHLEALMRTPDWQHKMQRAAHKSSLKAHERRERDRDRDVHTDEHRNKKHVEHRKKYQRLKKGGSTLTSIQKIKKKLTRGRKPKNHDADNLLRHKRKHKFRRNSTHPSHSAYDESGQDELRVEVAGSGHPSPAPSPGDERAHNFVTERSETLRRKRENSYDIDNIVIPYSIASSTRVEKLQYKEILIPKWRVVDLEPTLDIKNNGIVRRSSHESDVEDVSDEAVMLRHERCEHEERKKFMAYVKNPNNTRHRIHRRTDSRAGSSGANTPDPMSPNNVTEHTADGVSPVTSPPATPGAASIEHDPSSMGIPGNAASQLARRRTVSQSRFLREEYMRSVTPDFGDEVAPFEPRIFPLSDDMYEKMLRQMPEGYPGPLFMISNPSSVADHNEVRDPDMDLNDNQDANIGESLPGSPSTDTDSAPGEEDPNDPEWTIGDTESSVKR